MGQKAMALIFDTDFQGSIMEGEAIDGKFLLKMGKQYKEWILSIPKVVKDENGKDKTEWMDVKPFMVKGKLGGAKPMYLLKWNSLYPLAFNVKNEKKIFLSPDTSEALTLDMKTLEMIVPDFKDTKILPELLGETHDLRFLKGMKKYVGGEEGGGMKGILMFAGIVILLASIGYAVYYFFFQNKPS